MTAQPPTRPESTPRPVRHDGPCLERCEPPCGSRRLLPYRAAEVLAGGWAVACHLCGIVYRRGDPALCREAAS
jgi:hypothetical protein